MQRQYRPWFRPVTCLVLFLPLVMISVLACNSGDSSSPKVATSHEVPQIGIISPKAGETLSGKILKYLSRPVVSLLTLGLLERPRYLAGDTGTCTWMALL